MDLVGTTPSHGRKRSSRRRSWSVVCLSLSRPPPPQAPPVPRGCVRGFWLEQAYADEPPVVIDTVDRVSGQLELAHNGGREVNPTVVQFGKSDRPIAGPAQLLEHSLLLGVSGRHRRDRRDVKDPNVRLRYRRDRRLASRFATGRRLVATYRSASTMTSSTGPLCCSGYRQSPLCSSSRRCHPESEKSTELTERTKQSTAFRPRRWEFSERARGLPVSTGAGLLARWRKGD